MISNCSDNDQQSLLLTDLDFFDQEIQKYDDAL